MGCRGGPPSTLGEHTGRQRNQTILIHCRVCPRLCPQTLNESQAHRLWEQACSEVLVVMVCLPQQCCDCCGLGLRVRAEGQSCESNPNLGYPCNHVMLSCCEGEEPLIVPEVRRPPEPEAAPRRGGCCSPRWRQLKEDRWAPRVVGMGGFGLQWGPWSITVCGLRFELCFIKFCGC